ncbi:DUF1641 domain-containing protein [Halohasta litorea]|uniref:DUF1641 domain-containing protein n=1 Tax=Halohasta litorea TaxID=869891 RepID=A0ABD6DAG8_9EURY|nr:DUF1641 domain-containing protein [Halohasta litorea]
MAEPTDSYPQTATNRARKNGDAGDGDGQAAIQDALATNGEPLAALINNSDEFENALETAILVIASTDDEELDEITDSTANLVAAADGLSTDDAAALATELGENADELSASLETVVALQQAGHLDDLAALVTAFTESLSPDDIEALSALLSENGPELVDALDTVLELQREGQLEALVGTATTLSAIEIDEDAVDGMNDFLGAIGEARRDSEPVGLRGTVRHLKSRDLRAGVGYLLALLKAQGRRLRLG